MFTYKSENKQTNKQKVRAIAEKNVYIGVINLGPMQPISAGKIIKDLILVNFHILITLEVND